MASFERRNYSDQLNIDTPEQVDLQFHVAGLWSRFVAILIDHVIQFAFYVLLILVLVLVFSGYKSTPSAARELDSAGKWFIAAFIVANFCLLWGYFSLFEAFWKGQTPGKRVMRLRVIKDSGRQITLFEALARNLLRIVDYFPSLYLTGVITMLCNRTNKRLGDLAAGTLVVHEPREEQPMFVQVPAFFASNVIPGSDSAALLLNLFPADALAKLQPRDLLIIDTFFSRALDLSLETRASIAERVTREMCLKMGVPVPDVNSERALEAVVLGMRGVGHRF